jgi:hypothetical protein
MITTAFAHGVERVTLTRARDHLEIELYGPDRAVRSASLTVFGDSLTRTRPALTVDGVDVPAILDAANAALRALREAHEGNPVNLPLGVSEALDCLADLIEGR